MAPSNLVLPPQIRVFPTTDARLHAEAEHARDELLPEATSEEVLRRAVQRRLRLHYPNVVVRGRDELATVVSIEPAVWYVLRDGRVRLPSALRDRLYGALAASRDLVDTATSSATTTSETLGAAKAAVDVSQERRARRGAQGGPARTPAR